MWTARNAYAARELFPVRDVLAHHRATAKIWGRGETKIFPTPPESLQPCRFPQDCCTSCRSSKCLGSLLEDNPLLISPLSARPPAYPRVLTPQRDSLAPRDDKHRVLGGCLGQARTHPVRGVAPRSRPRCGVILHTRYSTLYIFFFPCWCGLSVLVRRSLSLAFLFFVDRFVVTSRLRAVIAAGIERGMQLS